MISDTQLAPRGFTDLRGQQVTELSYPFTSVVLVAGIPGAGKTMLLRRLYGDGASPAATDPSCPTSRPLPHRHGPVRILDSDQTRAAWRPFLGWLPYACWRPAMHTVHYARVRAAILAGGPLVIHDCGTRPVVRQALGRYAARSGLGVHLVLVDATPEQAAAGHRARGRFPRRGAFRTHCRRWRYLVEAVADDPGAMVPGAVSAVLLDRAAAGRLRAVRFGTEERPSPTRSLTTA